MAGLSLVNVKKIYPASNDQKKAKKAKKQVKVVDEKTGEEKLKEMGVHFNVELAG